MVLIEYAPNEPSLKIRSHCNPGTSSASEVAVLVAIAVLFASCCGAERLFAAMQFIFGLCGPLKLSPDRAVLIDEFYNGGYVLGRFFSIFLVKSFSPKSMLKSAVFACVASAVLVVLKADESETMLLTGAFVYGMSVSWQFGAGFSWASEHLDVVV